MYNPEEVDDEVVMEEDQEGYGSVENMEGEEGGYGGEENENEEEEDDDDDEEEEEQEQEDEEEDATKEFQVSPNSLDPMKAKGICNDPKIASARIQLANLKGALSIEDLERHFCKYGNICATLMAPSGSLALLQFKKVKAARDCLWQGKSAEINGVTVAISPCAVVPSTDAQIELEVKASKKFKKKKKRTETPEEIEQKKEYWKMKKASFKKFGGANRPPMTEYPGGRKAIARVVRGIDYGDSKTSIARVYVNTVHKNVTLPKLEERFRTLFGPLVGCAILPRPGRFAMRYAYVQFVDPITAWKCVSKKYTTISPKCKKRLRLRLSMYEDSLLERERSMKRYVPYRGPLADEELQDARIFVGYLDKQNYNTMFKLYEYFCNYGTVLDLSIHKPRGQYRGFAFVQFSNEDEAKLCLSGGSKIVIQGQHVEIGLAWFDVGLFINFFQSEVYSDSNGYPQTYEPWRRECHIDANVVVGTTNVKKRIQEASCLLPQDRVNDAEILALTMDLRPYAEYIKSLLDSIGLKVGLLFPPGDIPPVKLARDLRDRKSLFAIVLTQKDLFNSTVTLHVLARPLETHTAVTLVTCLILIEENFLDYVLAVKPEETKAIIESTRMDSVRDLIDKAGGDISYVYEPDETRPPPTVQEGLRPVTWVMDQIVGPNANQRFDDHYYRLEKNRRELLTEEEKAAEQKTTGYKTQEATANDVLKHLQDPVLSDKSVSLLGPVPTDRESGTNSLLGPVPYAKAGCIGGQFAGEEEPVPDIDSMRKTYDVPSSQGPGDSKLGNKTFQDRISQVKETLTKIMPDHSDAQSRSDNYNQGYSGPYPGSVNYNQGYNDGYSGSGNANWGNNSGYHGPNNSNRGRGGSNRNRPYGGSYSGAGTYDGSYSGNGGAYGGSYSGSGGYDGSYSGAGTYDGSYSAPGTYGGTYSAPGAYGGSYDGSYSGSYDNSYSAPPNYNQGYGGSYSGSANPYKKGQGGQGGWWG